MGFATIEEALEELRAGHLIMCIDDPDREIEGALICAAQFATCLLYTSAAADD